MGDVVCRRIKLRPGSLPKVREWARVLNERRDEARATLVDEGVSVESVFLEQGSDGDYLVYYLRAADIERAAAIAKNSSRDIDRYHQSIMSDVRESSVKLELLLDVDAPPS